MKLKQRAADGGLRVFAVTRSFLKLNHSDLAGEEMQVRKRGAAAWTHPIWALRSQAEC